MNDLISRQAAIEAVHEAFYTFFDGEGELTDMEEVLLTANKRVTQSIRDLHTAEPRKGRWEGGELGQCSNCGHEGCASDIWSGCNGGMYCPNCGADMQLCGKENRWMI